MLPDRSTFLTSDTQEKESVATLYDDLLPLLQAINEEGGNMSTFLLDKRVFDAIDGGARTDSSHQAIAAKIREKHKACKTKRSHLAFNQIFEAYSEGLVYLAATARGLDLRAVPDGGKHGKTPDFETVSLPLVGLELKTLNVVAPQATIDDVMDRGFEAGFEAEQQAKAATAASKSRGGVGFGETEHSPHGQGATALEAISQTIGKINSNLKQGQYSDRPTILVVSMARLGLSNSSVDLKRVYANHRNHQMSGHLFAVAAHTIGDAIVGYESSGATQPKTQGLLQKNGVLRDHAYVAGIAFVYSFGPKEKTLNDDLKRSVRVHGIWNNEWEKDASFTEEEKAHAKAVFDQFCDFWNDTADTRGGLITDVSELRSQFQEHVSKFANAERGNPAQGSAFEQFVIEADRLYHKWRCAEEKVDFTREYIPVTSVDISVGQTHDNRSAILVTAGRIDKRVPRLELVKSNAATWSDDDGLRLVTNLPVDI